MGRRRKITELRLLVLLIAACFALQIHASSENDVDAIFYEPFDESFEGRWIVSAKDEHKGVWKLSKSDGHDDYGLVLSEKEARKYAIVKELDEAVSLRDRTTTVLQFEVRLQNGLECGGAYLKYLLPQEAPEGYFDNDPPYSIMFGPEKCESVSTNKVHFIFKHKNPKSGEYVEHHLKNPPSVPADKLSHVYTAILKPDSEVIILVDGEEKNKASFLSTQDFEPALIPAKTIPDPNAVKPYDWDESHSYKGIWKPQQIPNPDSFETEKPDFEAIAAIGIEIWTMQDGILFDNILIADDEKVAESYRITKWKPKFDAEKEKQKAEDSAGGLFSSFLRDLIAVILLTVLFRILLGGKKPAPTMTINTVDHHELPHSRYDVFFYNDQIDTLVTHSAPMVESWLSKISPIIHENPIIGLDVESNPNPFTNPIATLQLCVGHHCLIYQLIHTQNIPKSLFDFLANRSYTFVGSGIKKDVDELLEDYELKVTNAVELGVLVAKRLSRSGLEKFGLKRLAREVLRKEMKKSEVSWSKWDSECLTVSQIEYACIDAFVSSEIGRRLNPAA